MGPEFYPLSLRAAGQSSPGSQIWNTEPSKRTKRPEHQLWPFSAFALSATRSGAGDIGEIIQIHGRIICEDNVGWWGKQAVSNVTVGNISNH